MNPIAGAERNIEGDKHEFEDKFEKFAGGGERKSNPLGGFVRVLAVAAVIASGVMSSGIINDTQKSSASIETEQSQVVLKAQSMDNIQVITSSSLDDNPSIEVEHALSKASNFTIETPAEIINPESDVFTDVDLDGNGVLTLHIEDVSLYGDIDDNSLNGTYKINSHIEFDVDLLVEQLRAKDASSASSSLNNLLGGFLPLGPKDDGKLSLSSMNILNNTVKAMERFNNNGGIVGKLSIKDGATRNEVMVSVGKSFQASLDTISDVMDNALHGKASGFSTKNIHEDIVNTLSPLEISSYTTSYGYAQLMGKDNLDGMTESTNATLVSIAEQGLPVLSKEVSITR